MKTINRVIIPIVVILAAGTVFFTAQPIFSQHGETVPESVTEENTADNLEVATFGAGCFWSIEALYERLDGVASVESGYAGGWKENPTREELSEGTTGHAEVVQIKYDPRVISYNNLLEVFWKVHDPTTLNSQGNDVGPMYRSMILYHNEDQKRLAEESMRKASKEFEDPIVTEIEPLNAFYPADQYHQDFYDNNQESRYCRSVIAPKLRKMKRLGFYD